MSEFIQKYPLVEALVASDGSLSKSRADNRIFTRRRDLWQKPAGQLRTMLDAMTASAKG